MIDQDTAEKKTVTVEEARTLFKEKHNKALNLVDQGHLSVEGKANFVILQSLMHGFDKVVTAGHFSVVDNLFADAAKHLSTSDQDCFRNIQQLEILFEAIVKLDQKRQLERAQPLIDKVVEDMRNVSLGRSFFPNSGGIKR